MKNIKKISTARVRDRGGRRNLNLCGTHKIQIRFSQWMYKFLKRRAKALKMSISLYVNLLVQDALTGEGEDERGSDDVVGEKVNKRAIQGGKDDE